MCGPSAEDWIKIAPPRPGFERIEAQFAGHAFDPHRHDTYALGITTEGVQSFGYRGSERHSEKGNVIVLHPDEVHDGHAGGEHGFRYRMLYMEPRLVRDAFGTPNLPLPFVRNPVTRDGALVGAVSSALADIDRPLDELEADQIISDLAAALHAADRSAAGHAGKGCDMPAMARVRECLDGSVEAGVRSQDLETLSGLDRYAIARQFRKCFGTSPYRYLTMRRLDRARELILSGTTLSEAAISCGFADQSHLTRHFKRALGMPPGRWAAMVRGADANRLM